MCSQDETSEIFIGEWAEKRNIRDQLVIATKVLCAPEGSRQIY
jgi:aryl-alcohol dehydrogenase-like predicted oxidoreductase